MVKACSGFNLLVNFIRRECHLARDTNEPYINIPEVDHLAL
jgi:hypothetical protein